MKSPRGTSAGGLGSWARAIRRDRKGLFGACVLGVFTLVAETLKVALPLSATATPCG